MAKVESPFAAEGSGQVSADRHSVLVPIEIAGSIGHGRRQDRSDRRAHRRDPAGQSRLLRRVFGESTGEEIKTAFFDDLKKAGLYSIPLTLGILLIAFGARVAAGIRSCSA